MTPTSYFQEEEEEPEEQQPSQPEEGPSEPKDEAQTVFRTSSGRVVKRTPMWDFYIYLFKVNHHPVNSYFR